MSDLDPRFPLVQFPFGGGIDEASRDELVEPGQGWAVLENGRQNHRGGYSTRNGFDTLSSERIDGSTRASGDRLFAHRSTIAVVGESQIDVYDPKSAKWSACNRPPPCAMRLIDVPSVASPSRVEDVEYCNGYFAVVWQSYGSGSPDPGSAWVSVSNAETGATIGQPTGGPISSIEDVTIGLASYGPYIFMISACGTAGATTLYASYLDTTSATTINAGWVDTGIHATVTDLRDTRFASQGLSDKIAVAYRNQGGGVNRITVKTFSIAGVLQTQTVATASVLPDHCDIAGSSSDTLWVAWNQAAAVKLRGLSPSNITATALATTATILTASLGNVGGIWVAPSATAGQGRLFIADVKAASPGIDVQFSDFVTTAGAAATSGSAVTVHNINISGKPIQYGGRYLAQVFYGDGAYSGNTQKSVFLVDTTQDAGGLFPSVRPIANPAPSLSTESNRAKGKIAVGSVASKLYWVIGVTRSTVADATVIVECDFASATRWQTVAHGRATFMPGGVTSVFDGIRVVESGFLVRPAIPTTSTGSTGITAVTGWKYAVVWEYVDANGNWAVSGVSDPSASTGAVNNKTVTVSTYALTITSRQPGINYKRVRAAFYRTLDGGEAPYYRLGTADNNSYSGTPSLSYTDTTTDATLATASKLYSQPGVRGTSQDRRGPPGFSCLVSYNGMLVGSFGSDVWYSGQDVTGEATWSSPVFQVPVPGEGDITALWAMDGTLFAAKRREVYAMNGEPPADNGTSGGLGFPRRLAVDVGAISPFTCATAFGTFFRSDRGIEIMNRSQAVEWVGEGVQDTLADYPVVTAMTVDPVSCTVLIEVASATSSGLVTGNGRTLVYDLSLRSWQSTDRRTSSAGAADTPAQSGCMLYTGTAWRYGWLGANGVVYTESTDHLDSGYFINKRAVTGHVKVSGLQGFQHVNKVLLLGKKHTSHDVSLSFAYDYSDTYKTARLYTATQVDALTALIPNMQLEHGLHDDSRCEAVRIQITDATPSTGESVGTGQAGTWVALAFEAVPQQGAYLLPDEAK